MAVPAGTQITRINLGTVGVKPGRVYIYTTDSLENVTTPGWLSNNASNPVQFENDDITEIMYAVGPNGGGSYNVLSTSVDTNGIITFSANF